MTVMVENGVVPVFIEVLGDLRGLGAGTRKEAETLLAQVGRAEGMKRGAVVGRLDKDRSAHPEFQLDLLLGVAFEGEHARPALPY